MSDTQRGAARPGLEDHIMSQVDRTRERLIATYRKKARHYDVTSRFYPAPGYPQRSQRLRTVQALSLRPGGCPRLRAVGQIAPVATALRRFL